MTIWPWNNSSKCFLFSIPVLWSRAFRSRGGPNQMIVAHADGSNYLQFLNTNESGGNDVWQHLVDFPLANCAYEHLSIARWWWWWRKFTFVLNRKGWHLNLDHKAYSIKFAHVSDGLNKFEFTCSLSKSE